MFACSAEDTDLARQNEALFGSQADEAGPQSREETVPPNSQRKAMTVSRDAPLLVNSTPRDDASGAQPLLDDASLPQGPSLQSNEQRYDSASSHSGQAARNDLKTGMVGFVHPDSLIYSKHKRGLRLSPPEIMISSKNLQVTYFWIPNANIVPVTEFSGWTLSCPLKDVDERC